MLDLLAAGGYFSTIPLTFLAGAVLALTLKKALDLFGQPDRSPAELKRGLAMIVQIGCFSFFYGLLGQAIGLYQALTAIEAAGDVSPAMMAGGLRVSMIAPLYGLLIFLASAVCWFVLKLRYDQLVEE